MSPYEVLIHQSMTGVTPSEGVAVQERVFVHMSPLLNFQINDADPPEGAAPRGRGYWLRRPEPKGTDGSARPVKAIGQPYVQVNFQHLSQTGWNWYVAFLADEEDLSVDLTSVTVWDPLKDGGPGWVRFTGTDDRPIILRRPTYTDVAYGGFEGVQIMIVEIS